MTETEKIRFKLLNKLVKYKLIVTSSGCWVKEGTNTRKYTTAKFNKKYFKLHVLSAIIFLNHDFETKLACHKCDIEGCCNPSHLYSGTNQDNANDSKYRRKNKIEKGQVINRIETSSEETKFELNFLPDETIN